MNWNPRQREFDERNEIYPSYAVSFGGRGCRKRPAHCKTRYPFCDESQTGRRHCQIRHNRGQCGQIASWSASGCGIRKIAFSLRYQEIKIGTGADAQPNKIYKVNYTGWLASDGHKFDSSYDHRPPVLDKDGKPVLDADGKPKLNDPQPIGFPQGFGRVIPGWDQGFNGMKIGGKRRLFIPWQLAYGAAGRPGPDAAHPGIPPKADLIFDVELVEITDVPTQPSRPGMPPTGASMPRPPAGAPAAAPAAPATPKPSK